jgi:transcriptional regulator with XRE-family HTH domain
MRDTSIAGAATAERADSGFGTMLREWRRRRGASQLELALRSGVSQRHVSFLESGRARPSREMVGQLAGALDVPLRQQNALLLAAGFAPVYRERDLGAPELGVVRQALTHMLKQQEPYPAVVVDRLWNLLDANEPASRMTAFLLDGVPGADKQSGKRPNLLRSILSRELLRTRIDNWEDVARHLVRSTYAEILADGGDEEALRFIDDVMVLPDVPRAWRHQRFDETPTPVLSVDFRKGDTKLRLFTTIATLGTPQDVTLQEVRVECFFPADEATERFFRRS